MRACASLLALCLAAGPVAAQEADSDFFEQGENLFKSETIEGVSKHAESPLEAPATVTVISRSELEHYGFRTVADVLNFASLGNFSLGDRRYELAGSRGLYFFEDFNTRILVMLNGHVLNEPWANFAGLDRSMLVPLDLVERIEIVYGPSALLYGGYSLYGIVNVVTRTGGTLPGARVRGTLGSWWTRETVASWGKTGVSGLSDDAWELSRPAKEWSLLVAAGYYQTDGEDLDLPRLDAGYPVAADGSSIWGGPQEGTDREHAPFALVQGRYGDFSLLARAGFRKRGAPFAPYGAIYGSKDQTLKDAKHFVELKWDRQLPSGLALQARLFHDVYSYDEQDPYADAESYPGESGYLFDLQTDDHDTGLELRLNYRRGAHYFTAGVEGRYRSLGQLSQNRFFSGAVAPGSRLQQEVDGTFGVLYAQDEWRPSDVLSLVGGGNVATTDPGGTKALPRLAVIVKPRPRLSVKALYGRGFRPPSIFEASYTDFQSQIDNPALRSESITSYELSAIWEPTPRLSLQAYGFHSRLEGLIQGIDLLAPEDAQGGVRPPSGDPADLVGLLQYQSAGDVPSKGLGASLRLRGRAVQAHLNVAWAKAHLEGRDGSRSDLGGSARWLGSGGVSYTRGAWVGSLVARYVGPQPLALSRGGGETDGFVEANARVLHRTRLFYPVTFYLDVQNLFGTEGDLAASPVYAPATLPIEGRRALLSAEVRF